ncbi:MAG: hypothetical protein QOJ07_738 [Thermoleophilaceae bacterium]|nr:hypothetical protein [Thermoleophilaceae bacterium]
MRELERIAALPSPPANARIAVVGRGRLGSALVPALGDAGFTASGPHGRGAPPASDVVVLCVPDAQIEAAATAAAGSAPLVGHTSGATPLSALDGAEAEAFGLHPLQTFTGAGGTFAGCGCAIGGATPRALATADRIARALGMRPFELADAARPAYHAAASIASNFLVTIEAAAEQVAAGAGLAPAEARALLAPLVRSTVDNWAALGPDDALTGPVRRGDSATVERQRAAVVATAPELAPLWDALVEATRALASVREEQPA